MHTARHQQGCQMGWTPQGCHMACQTLGDALWPTSISLPQRLPVLRHRLHRVGNHAHTLSAHAQGCEPLWREPADEHAALTMPRVALSRPVMQGMCASFICCHLFPAGCGTVAAAAGWPAKRTFAATCVEGVAAQCTVARGEADRPAATCSTWCSCSKGRILLPAHPCCHCCPSGTASHAETSGSPSAGGTR